MTGTDPWRAGLPPELVDLITEAVAMPETAARRAEVVTALLLQALDAVTWRQGSGADPTERSSLMRVVEAAAAHQELMSGSAMDAARGADRARDPAPA